MFSCDRTQLRGASGEFSGGGTGGAGVSDRLSCEKKRGRDLIWGFEVVCPVERHLSQPAKTNCTRPSCSAATLSPPSFLPFNRYLYPHFLFCCPAICVSWPGRFAMEPRRQCTPRRQKQQHLTAALQRIELHRGTSRCRRRFSLRYLHWLISLGLNS
jgi:hypothetical protein